MKIAEVKRVLEQPEERAALRENGSGAWTVVYDSWNKAGSSGGKFAAFSHPDRRSFAHESADWDLRKGQGLPGFVQSYEGGEEVVRYYRYHDTRELEPLVIVQEHHGVVPDVRHISEEFRLLMNLWQDPATGNYYSLGEDGSKDLAIKFDGERINIRTPLLRRYQAARQLDLLLFVDSTVSVDTDLPVEAFADITEDDRVEGDCVLMLATGEVPLKRHGAFSRFLGKRILQPPPQATCGLWPWDDVDQEYHQFIIGEDDSGRPVKASCNPDGLANYYGANPDAPHYLTPVFFKPEVLTRYYDDPSRFTVGDGRLSCARLWSIQIDNGGSGHVSVFLGDLGRDLPESHRDHWKAHNIPPTGQMSETAIRRSFYGQFAESGNPEHLFKDAYARASSSWQDNFGWPLYRGLTGSDADIVKRLRIPSDETDVEFESQVLNLTKLLVDSINEKEVVKGLPPVEGEKGIGKLERFLTALDYQHTDRDIQFLRRLQRLRSRSTAHVAGASGQAELEKLLGGRTKRAYFQQLLGEAAVMLQDLSELEPATPTGTTA